MRRIKMGDEVQAFLDTRIKGTVIEIKESKSAPWLVGGTASVEMFCVLKLKDGRDVLYKMSELHHIDE